MQVMMRKQTALSLARMRPWRVFWKLTDPMTQFSPLASLVAKF